MLVISSAEAQKGTRLKKELRFIPERSTNSKIIEDGRLRSRGALGLEARPHAVSLATQIGEIQRGAAT